MSRICDICEKEYLKGNLIARGIGKRVSRRTTMRQMPNLRSKKLDLGGRFVRVKICASCLKRLKFEQKQAQDQVQATA